MHCVAYTLAWINAEFTRTCDSLPDISFLFIVSLLFKFIHQTHTTFGMRANTDFRFLCLTLFVLWQKNGWFPRRSPEPPNEISSHILHWDFRSRVVSEAKTYNIFSVDDFQCDFVCIDTKFSVAFQYRCPSLNVKNVILGCANIHEAKKLFTHYCYYQTIPFESVNRIILYSKYNYHREWQRKSCCDMRKKIGSLKCVHKSENENTRMDANIWHSLPLWLWAWSSETKKIIWEKV